MKEEHKDILKFIALTIICGVIFSVIILLTVNYSHTIKGLSSNELGDSAGLANGLFSALAFAGVIYAIILQKKELRLQREELEHTREELQGQKQEFQLQNQTLKSQRFENTFFHLLSLHHEIVNQLRAGYTAKFTTITDTPTGRIPEDREEKISLEGREVFLHLFEYHPTYYKRKKFRGMRSVLSEHDISAYEQTNTPSQLDHYFRNLYRIIKYVDGTNLLDSDKQRYDYITLVRAQLSEYELVWLFYNCLSYYGYDKFKPLIEKYAIFQNLRSELLVNPNHIESYEVDAMNETPTVAQASRT